jgi:hypothetical protein
MKNPAEAGLPDELLHQPSQTADADLLLLITTVKLHEHCFLAHSLDDIAPTLAEIIHHPVAWEKCPVRLPILLSRHP